MTTLHIFIDDSGQLNPNYPHSDFFVYGGYWTLSSNLNQVERYYRVLHRQIFGTNLEIKASDMSIGIKKQITNRMLKKFPEDFNPVFESIYVPQMTIDFESKQAVQLHKNYLIRRLVEKVILEKRKYFPKILVDEVVIIIDNQSQTKLNSYDSLERYLNKSMHNQYFTESYVKSSVPYKARFKDSKISPSIQLCDILANSKYGYHNGKFPVLKSFLNKKGVAAPLKLPTKWETKDC